VQINPGELQKGQGTGLGLSISKSIVHLHGGNIGMSSEGVGKGSIFYIELPSYQKTRDDALGDFYDSVLDHSRIFGNTIGANSRKVKRSYSRSSSCSPRESHSYSQSHGRNSRSNGKESGEDASYLSDQIESLDSPRKTRSKGLTGNAGTAMLERTGSFCSSDIKSRDKHKIPNNKESSDSTATDDNIANCKSRDNQMRDHGMMKERDLKFKRYAYEQHHEETDLEQGLAAQCQKPIVDTGAVSEVETDSSIHGKVAFFQTLFTAIGLNSNQDKRYRSKVVVPATNTDEPNHSNAATSELPNHVATETIATETSIAAQAPVTSALPNVGDIPVSHISPQTLLPSQTNANPNSGNTANNRLRASFSAPQGKHYNILVVDDSVPNRKMLSRLLTRDQHIVTEAGDGTEAVDIVRESLRRGPAFDLILMDFYMTHMNGPEAVKAIRKLGYSGMILGVSGVMDDDVHYFIESGANLVLCKPISLAGLWKALRGTSFFEAEGSTATVPNQGLPEN
jgi:CheY-like chemotaxis protein